MNEKNHSGFSFFTKDSKIDVGRRILKMNPAQIERDPKPRQRRCIFRLKGTVFIDCPPNSTHSI